MSTEDLLRVVALVLASLGGGAIVVVGLASWLGSIEILLKEMHEQLQQFMPEK